MSFNFFFLPFVADQTGTYDSIKNAFTPHQWAVKKINWWQNVYEFIKEECTKETTNECKNYMKSKAEKEKV